MILDMELRRDFTIGERARFSKTITEGDVTSFAGIIGDFYPLHVDEEYASQTRFGARIAHGMLIGGLISAALGNKLPGPGAIYLSQQMEFHAPVYIGDTITAIVEVVAWRPEKRIVTLRTDCFNQEDRQVVTGKAVLMVERPKS